ncbi:MAG TPA: hypothetical protein EYP43_04385, partial [Thermoplasmata archaeon]|nr:hypothetical protein [Thermoplasmata archaeon]
MSRWIVTGTLFALMLLSVVVVGFPHAEATDRLVVAEVLTAQNCPYCAVADPEVSEFFERNRGEVVIIAYHPEEFKGVPDPMGIPFEAVRRATIDFEGYPTVVFDGLETVVGGYEGVSQEYQAELDARMGVDAPLRLNVDVALTGDRLMATVNGTPERDVLHETGLYVVLTEDHVDYRGNNGIDDFRFVARDVRSVSVLVISGEDFSESFSFPTAGMDTGYLRVVAFVMDMETGEILQGAAARVKGSDIPAREGDDGGGGGLTPLQVTLLGVVIVILGAGAFLVWDDRRRRALRGRRPRKGGD